MNAAVIFGSVVLHGIIFKWITWCRFCVYKLFSHEKNAESWIQVLVITGPVHPAMGKSPAKWIKTVLFGKKTSKSNISKGREVIS